MQTLSQNGINVTATAILSATQAMLSAEAGAKYVAPYVSRLEKALTDYCEFYYPYLKEVYPKAKLLLLIDRKLDHNEVAWRYHFPYSFDFNK